MSRSFTTPSPFKSSEAEVRNEYHRSCAEYVDLAGCAVVLELTPYVQRMPAKGRRERIAELVAVKVRRLWKIEIRAVRKIGEDKFIGQV